MTRPPVVLEEGRGDVVSAVLVPIDGVTRRPVRSGVQAQLWDPVRRAARHNRLIRNLSGHLVLVNEPSDRELTFRIDPGTAGYRGPLFVAFTPDADGVSRVVALEPRPERAFDAGTTLVRGCVGRSARSGSAAPPSPVAGLTITAGPRAGAAGHQFPATTDERGVFALVVGLRVSGMDDDAGPIPTTLRFEKSGLPVREFDVDLHRGRTHVFTAAVDLDRDDRPPLALHSRR